MKKTILLFMTFFTFSGVTFASFPIVEGESTELVSNTQSESKAPNSKMMGTLLGFFLGIFGVLIAYLIGDYEMVRGAWRGFLWAILIYVIIWLAVLVAFAGTVAVVV